MPSTCRRPVGDASIDSRYAPPMENEDIVEAILDDAPIEEELLIEEISIDGMCGVY